MMAQKTWMRLLGVVENMSGERLRLGRRRSSSPPRSGPTCSAPCRSTRALRQAGDDGRPVVLSDPESESAHAIAEIAARIASTARERGLGQVVRPLPVVS